MLHLISSQPRPVAWCGSCSPRCGLQAQRRCVPTIAVRAPASVSRLACGLPGAAHPVVVQPVPDSVPVDSQLAGDLGEQPPLLDHAVNQIGPQTGEAEIRDALGELLVGGPAALAGAADLPWGPIDAGLGEQRSRR